MRTQNRTWRWMGVMGCGVVVVAACGSEDATSSPTVAPTVTVTQSDLPTSVDNPAATPATVGGRVLQYGQIISSGGTTCESESIGISCWANSVGFTLARDRNVTYEPGYGVTR